MSLAKGVALITGSAQGIGRSIALRLARDGFDIALNDVSPKRDQLRAVANDIEKIGRRTHLVPADVSIEGEVRGMMQGATEKLGGLDMVANAGVGMLTDLLSTGLDEWERIMAVNARGTFLCYKYAAAQMIAQGRGGRIIGASSVAGKMGHPLASAYSASKFAVRGITQTAAVELGRYKITVNSYAPGVIETPMSTPIKHDGQPEDIASIVSYLASKEAHFITGKYPLISFGVLSDIRLIRTMRKL
ncbi:NAD(P)-binding protein [Imleria badia]|nr:NAD(P)-binding protein [Imleria badia]